MAEITVPLPKGSKFGERIATVAILREVGTGDMIGAGEESEKCVQGPDGAYHLVVSPTLSGFHMLRRQIMRLEDSAGTVLDGPLTPDMMFRLAPEDFLAVQAKAQEMDKAVDAAMEEVARRGRGDTAS